MIMANSGKLFYVIGASGAGKDSLLRYARQHLANDESVAFVHRYITRPVELLGENHIMLSDNEFDSRQQSGCFAMHWYSHGFKYGIGVEINQWLENGINVVANGSRAYLKQALEIYPELTPILINVSQEILKKRLLTRGREDTLQIDKRLQRAVEFENVGIPQLISINNEGPIENAGELFIQTISQSTHNVKKCTL